jgi:outer membrane lipoprotein-sorting protein
MCKMSGMTQRCLLIIVPLVVAACGGAQPPDAGDALVRGRQAWAGDWHAVWQIEWTDVPVRGPLVAEVWHAADGRQRVETLEAPTAALNGLTLVEDGESAWLYDVRANRVQRGANDRVRIPLASDALDVVEWLLAEAEGATVDSVRGDMLESGPVTRLVMTTGAGDRATLWIHDETGLPAGVELRSGPWGEVRLVTRSISPNTPLDPALFVFQAPPGAEVVSVGSGQ